MQECLQLQLQFCAIMIYLVPWRCRRHEQEKLSIFKIHKSNLSREYRKV
jgi:hypothetical protein